MKALDEMLERFAEVLVEQAEDPEPAAASRMAPRSLKPPIVMTRAEPWAMIGFVKAASVAWTFDSLMPNPFTRGSLGRPGR